MSSDGSRRSGAARAPAHQNSTAFKHNPRSRKTAQIARIPNEGLCSRCHAIIEWRKRYRKYKPLDQPRKCTACQQKAVRFAYHTLCTPCSQSKKVCPKCLQSKELVTSARPPLSAEALMTLMADRGLRERRRRLILRLWEGGDKTDDELRALVDRAAREVDDREEEEEGEDDDDWGHGAGEEEEAENDAEERKVDQGRGGESLTHTHSKPAAGRASLASSPPSPPPLPPTSASAPAPRSTAPTQRAVEQPNGQTRPAESDEDEEDDDG